MNYQSRLLESSDPFQPLIMQPLKDSRAILTEGKNVAELAIHDETLNVMRQNPNLTYEQALDMVNKEWKQSGISIDDVLGADGINVEFNLPEYQKFNGVYGKNADKPLNAHRAGTTTHENTHLLQRHVTDNPQIPENTYNADGFRQPKNHQELYFSDQEKSAFGSEILGILGKNTRNLTGEELRLLHNYPGLGFNYPYIKELLDMVSDYDKAAKWINEHSIMLVPGIAIGGAVLLNNTDEYKKGGKLIKRFK